MMLFHPGHGPIVFLSFGLETPERAEDHRLLTVIWQMAAFITVDVDDRIHIRLLPRLRNRELLRIPLRLNSDPNHFIQPQWAFLLRDQDKSNPVDTESISPALIGT